MSSSTNGNIYVVIEDSKAKGYSKSEKEAKEHLLRRAQALSDKDANLTMRIEDDGMTIKMFVSSGFFSQHTIMHLLAVTTLKEISSLVEC